MPLHPYPIYRDAGWGPDPFSEQQLQAANECPRNNTHLSFRRGDALATGLPDECGDIVFERALIHFIPDLAACFREAYRLLAHQGVYVIQESTPDDVLLAGSPEHIRGYFFERFPRLSQIETARRPDKAEVLALLKQEGFVATKTFEFWETRQVHPSFSSLTDALRKRTGRSILHDLSNEDLSELVEFIGQRLPHNEVIIEKDRWTIWSAQHD